MKPPLYNPFGLTPEQEDWFRKQIPSYATTTRRVSKTGKVRYDGPNGAAAPPGTGPKGETCKTCRHSCLHGGGSKNYWKCDLVRATNGPGSDIRLKWPACRKWEAKP